MLDYVLNGKKCGLDVEQIQRILNQEAISSDKARLYSTDRLHNLLQVLISNQMISTC